MGRRRGVDGCVVRSGLAVNWSGVRCVLAVDGCVVRCMLAVAGV